MRNKASRERQKENIPQDVASRLINIISVSTFVLFVLLAFYLTVIHNKELLIKLDELSLFLPTWTFFTDFAKVPGGIFAYSGTFLTQFFYYPWLGSLIFVLLLLLIQYLTLKAFNIQKAFYALSFIPSLAILLSLTELGYLIYILKSPGYVYSNLYGVILVLGSFWAYRKISPWQVRTIYEALFIAFFYPLAGFYALLSAILFGFYEMLSFRIDRDKFRFVPLFITLVFIILVPMLCYQYFYTWVSFANIYTSGLPVFILNRKEAMLWLPFFILFVALFYFVFMQFNKGRQLGAKTPILAGCMYLVVFFIVCTFSFKDENFRAELAINHAIVENNWDKVLEINCNLKGEPTRMIVLGTNLALQKLSLAGDKMFAYKNGAKLYNTPRPIKSVQTDGPIIYFQYGKINYCYRWCMENMVEYGPKVQYLKSMVKCALLNQEYALARKYNDLLKKTLFYKSWALKYQKLIDNSSLIAADPEFSAILPLTAYDDVLDGDNGFLETYLLNDFANMRGGPLELVELSLQSNLELKNIERFWPRFFLYARTHKRLPVHYQEAALLYSYLEKKVDVSKLRFDRQIVEDFQELIRMSERYSNVPENESKQIFAKRFGNTFWYYYFFVNNLKTF